MTSRTIMRNALKHEAQLISLAGQNLTREQIANTLGISPQAVSTYSNVLGISIQRKKKDNPISQERLGRIIEARRNGDSLDEIGQRFGVSRERIRQILAKHFPDVTIQPRISTSYKPKKCQVCGVEFDGKSNAKTCSSKCGGLLRRGTFWCRNLAIEIMQLRDQGLTWDKVAEAVNPGCNRAAFRTSLQRQKEIIFSIYEKERYFKTYEVEEEPKKEPPKEVAHASTPKTNEEHIFQKISKMFSGVFKHV